ncbi:ferritin family protein [Plantactinospora siamensis]|uniref:Ferritin family protein n=1 Tax=Plantactinospora siamensis TaxID=555372 RepID=A0ABV6P2A2_9ACTN
MRTFAALTGLITGVVLAAGLGASAQAAPAVSPSTRDDTLTAMQGEAYAWARYLAYAQGADFEHHADVAALFRRTARVERYDHFAMEAASIGFVGTDVENLSAAIAGEEYEATTLYPRFARQAARDGCAPAAELFTELAADEAVHAQQFRLARDALLHPEGSQNFPVGERVTPVPIRPGPPRCTGRTLDNLLAATRGESFAAARYGLYAEHARSDGQRRLGRLFDNTASQELGEHFAQTAQLAGLVATTEDNLRGAIDGEQYEATTMYPTFSRRAAAAGDEASADMFAEIAHDEAGHAHRFTDALIDLIT